jgi:hypothetical protein
MRQYLGHIFEKFKKQTHRHYDLQKAIQTARPNLEILNKEASENARKETER